MKIFLGRIWHLFHQHADGDNAAFAPGLAGAQRTVGVYSILCSFDKKPDAGH
jgi:hypothetical protein